VMGFYETFFIDSRSNQCSGFGCKSKGNCGWILVQTIYQHNFVGSLSCLFFWLFLHIFWSRFLYSTSIDFFRKTEKKTDRLSIKSNLDNCNLSAYHAVSLIYNCYFAIIGTAHLVTSYGSLSVGDSIPFILSGIGYHVYSWSWRLRVNRKIKDKMVKFTSTNAVENFTAVALNVFTLYYICQELYTSQTEFSLNELEMGGHMTPQFRKLLHLHLAEQHSNIGSSLVRQFIINSYPSLLLKYFEFCIIQVRNGVDSVVIFGSQVNTKIILIIFAFFTFVISPVAIGRSNTGYVVAVVLLSFLRQIYIIYSIAKLSKSMRMPLQKPL